MKRCLESIINKTFKRKLELMFGKDSYVIINYCKYSTTTRRFVIDCKVIVSDIELAGEVYPDGLILLVNESWVLMSINEKISIITTIDIS
jgi:hypothetical protein